MKKPNPRPHPERRSVKPLGGNKNAVRFPAGFRLFFGAVLAFLWLGCSTVPKNFPDIEEGNLSILPSGGELYLWADVREARPILEGLSFDGFSLKDAGVVLDRTGTAAVVFNAGESAERFFMGLWGNYPTSRAEVSLAFSKDWKKRKSAKGGGPYWFSKGHGIGLALGPALALVSRGDPYQSLPAPSAAAEVPAGFEEFRGESVMAGWIPEPREPVNKFLTALGIPIQIPAEDFFFRVRKIPKEGEDQWELEFRARTPSESQARGLVTLFSVARAFIINNPFREISGQNQGGVEDFLPMLFANLPAREETSLTIRSAVFDTPDLSLLFQALSVYLNQK